MKAHKSTILTNIFVLLMFSTLGAQEVENVLETRSSLILSYKVNNEWRLRLIPEIRLDENSDIDKYIIEGEISFKPIDFDILALSAKYRFITDVKDNSDNEYLSRFALSATIKEEFNRFEPALRVRYCNFSDDDYIDDDQLLRYKASLEYDIAKTSLTPFIGVELFHQLNDNELYKMRYSAGLDYKLFKKNYISLSYKLDYYLHEYHNKHIFDLAYKIKL